MVVVFMRTQAPGAVSLSYRACRGAALWLRVSAAAPPRGSVSAGASFARARPSRWES